MASGQLLEHFVRAAAAADRRYAAGEGSDEIGLGIEAWERLVADGALRGVHRVDAYLAASMLYARRHEITRDLADLGQAHRYLCDARRFVTPGTPADLQVRMSTAAYLMARYQSGGPLEDLDRAINGWAALVETRAGAFAAANLGRALLVRHDHTGDPADLQDGRLVLGLASARLPEDHPARADVERALSGVPLR